LELEAKHCFADCRPAVNHCPAVLERKVNSNAMGDIFVATADNAGITGAESSEERLPS
jgi:hypothetical protein